MDNDSLENFIKNFLTEKSGGASDTFKELGGGPAGPVRFAPRVSPGRPAVSSNFHSPTPRTITIPPSSQVGPTVPQVYVTPTPSIPAPQFPLIPQPGVASPKVEVIPASAERMRGPKAGYVEPMTGFEGWGENIPELKVLPKTSVDTGLSTRTSTGTQTRTSVDTGTRTSTDTATQTAIEPTLPPDFSFPRVDPRTRTQTSLEPQLQPQPQPDGPKPTTSTETELEKKIERFKRENDKQRDIIADVMYQNRPLQFFGDKKSPSEPTGQASQLFAAISGAPMQISGSEAKRRSFSKKQGPMFMASKGITEQQRQDKIDIILESFITESRLKRLNKVIAGLKEKKRQGDATQRDLAALNRFTRQRTRIQNEEDRAVSAAERAHERSLQHPSGR